VRILAIENIFSTPIWLPSISRIILANLENVEIVLHVLTTKEEGLPPFPKAPQMFKNKTTFTKPKFTQISCNKS
jgi:hypothetical protein